jgi:membrane-associated phospholipid phosphatase
MPSLRRCLAPHISRLRGLIVIAMIGLVVLTTAPKVEKYGDNLQIALPLLAWGCEIANGAGLEYLGRYAVLFSGIHSIKNLLGDAEINQRPRGGGRGFPSGHTATAVFGASSLVSSCLVSNPVARMVVIVAAGFTGTSRVDVQAHTIWQVLAGAIWGLICNYALRGDTAARRVVARGLARLGQRIVALLQLVFFTLLVGGQHLWPHLTDWAARAQARLRG